MLLKGNSNRIIIVIIIIIIIIIIVLYLFSICDGSDLKLKFILV